MRFNLKDPAILNRIFNTRQFHPEEAVRAQNIREAAKVFAHEIACNTPSCADQSAAIRKIREAMFTAISSIALNGDI